MQKTALLILIIFFICSFVKNKERNYSDISTIEKDMVAVPNTKIGGSIYIYKYEVSNFFYLQYLTDLQKINQEKYSMALPDTQVWRQKLSYSEPFVEYYFRHPAYREYPMVGISFDQCNMFCNWLTEKYNQYEKRKHKKVVFSLPTKEEWILAAKAGKEDAAFPFEKNSLQNERGEWMANFKVIPQDAILESDCKYELKLNESKLINHEYIDLTAPVKSYYPNKLGIFNMAGNVSEFVLEKGICKGGSWRSTAHYLQINREETYDTLNSASASRGFRFVMRVES